jgi:hypothetical protein
VNPASLPQFAKKSGEQSPVRYSVQTQAIPYTVARENLASTMSRVCSDHALGVLFLAVLFISGDRLVGHALTCDTLGNGKESECSGAMMAVGGGSFPREPEQTLP